jgi:hypothetical protein
MTAFIYRESSSGEGVVRCGVPTAFDLDAINSPSFRKVSKFSTVSSSSSTRIPKSRDCCLLLFEFRLYFHD